MTLPDEARVRTDIYRWAYRILRDHHDALDATQDVLVKWLNQRRPVRRKRAWLRSTTVNHCIDLVRRRRPTSDVEPEAPDDAPAPADDLAARERDDHILACLARLSDMQRAVLLAKVYDRETFASVADALGISTSSAKTHYVRALQVMRDMLPHETQE